ncbi:hypothetical protein [Roseomonas xinghualingensis]|uniref:hypothetical protein n=1 Tax=Roseomonas xinghualingensis TaxID=2986475 RepID=UPI0021F18027|nr:hypothetical protein [Roseomonas sp. SXEYE001]MCV4208569.1 hypothetical protein [Roseomonas sp. SXEYE001]
MPRTRARRQPRVTITLGHAGYLGRQGSQDERLSNLEDFALRQRLKLVLSFLREVEQALRSRDTGRQGWPPHPSG